MNRWRKSGKAYRLTDDYSTLWISRVGSQFHLLYRMEEAWSTLGVYGTLKAAQEAGNALMADEEAKA